MPEVTANGARLYYETHGAGFPLVLISGLGGAAASWANQVAPFAQRFRVLVHDQRGTHRSERSRIDYSIDQMAADAIALMDALEIERAHLIGHSTGGAIAQTMAILHPERIARLGLVSTFPKADPFLRRVMEMRMGILRGLGVEAYLQATPYFLFPPWWLNARDEEKPEPREAPRADSIDIEIMASRMDAILAFDRTAALADIARPVLVVGARNDILTPLYFSEMLADAIPGAALGVMEDAAHACNQTRPEEFNRLMLDFLAAD